MWILEKRSLIHNPLTNLRGNLDWKITSNSTWTWDSPWFLIWFLLVNWDSPWFWFDSPWFFYLIPLGWLLWDVGESNEIPFSFYSDSPWMTFRIFVSDSPRLNIEIPLCQNFCQRKFPLDNKRVSPSSTIEFSQSFLDTLLQFFKLKYAELFTFV